mgnify:CR=1 FL=1
MENDTLVCIQSAEDAETKPITSKIKGVVTVGSLMQKQENITGHKKQLKEEELVSEK